MTTRVNCNPSQAADKLDAFKGVQKAPYAPLPRTSIIEIYTCGAQAAVSRAIEAYFSTYVERDRETRTWQMELFQQPAKEF
jgi:hypothetical protein